MIAGYVVILHPSVHEAMARADARSQWRQQHRINRIAERDGVTPRQVERQFTGETVRFMGLDLILSDRVTASSDGA